MSVNVVVVAPGEPHTVWRRWSDVAQWPAWNTECLAADVDGPPGAGQLLDLRLRHPRSGRPFITRPRVVHSTSGERFTWRASGLGLRADIDARFTPEPDGTRIDLAATSDGPLAFTYRLTLTDRTLAVLYTRMLDALVEDLRS